MGLPLRGHRQGEQPCPPSLQPPSSRILGLGLHRFASQEDLGRASRPCQTREMVRGTIPKSQKGPRIPCTETFRHYHDYCVHCGSSPCTLSSRREHSAWNRIRSKSRNDINPASRESLVDFS